MAPLLQVWASKLLWGLFPFVFGVFFCLLPIAGGCFFNLFKLCRGLLLMAGCLATSTFYYSAPCIILNLAPCPTSFQLALILIFFVLRFDHKSFVEKFQLRVSALLFRGRWWLFVFLMVCYTFLIVRLETGCLAPQNLLLISLSIEDSFLLLGGCLVAFFKNMVCFMPLILRLETGCFATKNLLLISPSLEDCFLVLVGCLMPRWRFLMVCYMFLILRFEAGCFAKQILLIRPSLEDGFL